MISNKDVRALRALDLWLESVDTLEVLPNFPDETTSYNLPTVTGIDWDHHSEFVRRVADAREMRRIMGATSTQIMELLQFCWRYYLTDIISEVYARLLNPADREAGSRLSLEIVTCLIEFLHFTPTMAIHFVRLCPWNSLPIEHAKTLRLQAFDILHALMLSANRMGEMVVRHLCAVLQEDISLTLPAVKDLLESAALVVRSPDLLLTILMDCRDAFTTAISDHDSATTAYFLQNMFGIVLDHCADASESGEGKSGTWSLAPVKGIAGKITKLESHRRIDAPKLARLAVGDHVRFTASKEPTDSSAVEPTTFDALVAVASDNGVKFRCFIQPPIFLEKTAWKMKHCGPFVTTQTMGEALVEFLVQQDQCCGVYQSLLQPSQMPTEHPATVPKTPEQNTSVIAGLNASQSRAVTVSVGGRLTCLWGPPGTGKTSTIIALLRALPKQNNGERVLVAAPTHNAVDNVLRQYVKKALTSDPSLPQPLRVSTEVSATCHREESSANISY